MKVILVHNPLVWYKPDTWLYFLIRIFTKTQFNHGVIHVDIEGVPCIVDANFNGVIIRGNRDEWYTKEKRIIGVCNMPSIEGVTDEELVQRLVRLSHKKYDFLVYLTYVKAWILRLFGVKKVAHHKLNSRFYCFELIATIYKELYEEKLKNNEFITAKDFEQYLLEIRQINY